MKVSTVLSFSVAAIVAVNAKSFSEEEQAIWIDRHNFFRSTALPSAAGDMCRINWVSNLATKAASTASTCPASRERGVNVYQSSFVNSSSIIDEAVQEWVVETAMSTLDKMPQPGSTDHQVGVGIYNSYSQVVWASTTSVGCATASCSGGELIVCVYSPPGNDGKSTWYKHAPQGSQCPDGMEAAHGLCIKKGDGANNPIASIPEGEWTYQVYPAFVAHMHTLLIDSAREMVNKSTSESTNTDLSFPSVVLEEQALSSKSSSKSSETQDNSNYSPGEVKLNTEIDSAKEPHKTIAKSEENELSATELALNGPGNASEASHEVTAGGIFGMYFLGIATVAGVIVFVHFKERQRDGIPAK